MHDIMKEPCGPLQKKKKVATEKAIKTLWIPEEILTKIFLYLPVKSLVQFTKVCKSWRALIFNPRFVGSRLCRSIQNEEFSLLLVSRSDYFNLHFPIDFQSPDQPEKIYFPFGTITNIVGSCNGLICLSTTNSSAFFVVNPSTEFYTRLPGSLSPTSGKNPCHSKITAFGFGYTSLTGEYKVVQIDCVPTDRFISSYFQVCTLGTNSWRRTGIHCGYSYDDTSPGCFMNGSLHWLFKYNATDCHPESLGIVSFGIRDEKILSIPLPEFKDDNEDMACLRIIKGCLCIFHKDHTAENVEIWVMKEYGVRESWTLQFSITNRMMVWNLKQFNPLRFLQNGEILVSMSNGNLIIYDPRSDSSRDLILTRTTGSQVAYNSRIESGGNPVEYVLNFHMIDYVESLVSIKFN